MRWISHALLAAVMVAASCLGQHPLALSERHQYPTHEHERVQPTRHSTAQAVRPRRNVITKNGDSDDDDGEDSRDDSERSMLPRPHSMADAFMSPEKYLGTSVLKRMSNPTYYPDDVQRLVPKYKGPQGTYEMFFDLHRRDQAIAKHNSVASVMDAVKEGYAEQRSLHTKYMARRVRARGVGHPEWDDESSIGKGRSADEDTGGDTNEQMPGPVSHHHRTHRSHHHTHHRHAHEAGP